KVQGPPTTSIELLDRLKNLRCQHGREPALALRDQTSTQDRKPLIGQGTDFYPHECPSKHYAPYTDTRSRLFEATDVPVFANTADYEAFRGSLLTFFKSEDAPLPHEYGRALTRVLISFKDAIAHAVALGWDVTPFIRDDWTSTYTVFVAFLDSQFQSVTIVEDILEEYMGMENEEDSDSYDRFEAATNRIAEMRRRPIYETPLSSL
ncbi:hypothetical protein PSPO01_16203, partial [Paraphaeosphaeria sporulosa]